MENFLQQLVTGFGSLGQILAFDPALLSEPDMLLRLGLQMLLLMASAFFSGSETALFSLSRLDLQRLQRERNPQAVTLQRLLDRPRRLIISILCGNEIINVAAAANMTGILVVLYGDLAGVLNVLIMVPLLLLLGEVTPKTIAASDPIRVSSGLIARPMQVWVKLITPVRKLVRLFADRVTSLIVGEEKAAENILQIDEFKTLVDQVTDAGDLSATEHALIHNLLSAGAMEVVQIMLPRNRMHFLSDTLSVPEVIQHVRKARASRLPVFHGNRDNLVGFVHAEDLINLVLDGADPAEVELDELLHPLVVVIPTKKVDEMFDYLLDQRAEAAVVINEFGGVEGLVTIGQVLEHAFGHEAGAVAGEELYEHHESGVFSVPGDMKLNVFNDLTHFHIHDQRMTTIGGVMLRYLDRLPIVGDQVVVEGVLLEVLEMEGLRIGRVSASRDAGAVPRSEEAVGKRPEDEEED